MKNIWLSKAEIAALPTSGTAWNAVKAAADKATGAADLKDQNSAANVNCLAAALIYARTGDTNYLNKVSTSLVKITSGVPLGEALALGRELCAYVIAADVADYQTVAPADNALFESAIRKLLTASTSGGPSNLIQCQLQRPNNWGMHATASLAAVYAYLGDDVGLKSVANVFKGWLGDRTAYSAFKYGELDWQADPSKPVGVNPKGATIKAKDKNGVLQTYNVDGALPDDMRRGGAFAWPPKATGYPWEALQGATVAAQILTRAGYPAWGWSDKALLRAVQFLYSIDWPAVGDDGWQPWLINYAYGTNFPTSQSGTTGKNMGFTSWTHAAPVIVKPPVDPPPPPPVDPPPTDPCAACQAELATTKDELAKVNAEMAQIKTSIEEWLKWWDGD